MSDIMVSLFKKRVLAYIADYFVVSAIMWIIAQLLAFIIMPYTAFFVYDYFIILLPFVQMIYFVLLETKKGTTVGKHLVYLKVVSTSKKIVYSNPSFQQTFIRNLSKIYWLPIIIDLIIGRFYGSSNERILGRISMTEIVSEETETNKLPELNE
jgi:uncharacterized RDD family membrane protein YckC